MFESSPRKKEQSPSAEHVRSMAREFTFVGLGSVLAIATAASHFRNSPDINDYQRMEKIAQHEVEKRVSALPADDLGAYEASMQLFKEKIGFGGIMTLLPETKSPVENVESQGQPNISGFEHTNLISNEDIQQATTTTFFPIGWMQPIVSITYENAPLHYMDGRGEIVTLPDGAGVNVNDEITLSKLTVDTSVRIDSVQQRYAALSSVLQMLQHEVCHSNDWSTKNDRSFSERTQLLSQIIARVESQDPYKGHPVKNKQGERVDYHLLHGYESPRARHRAYSEYFASICQEYLSHSEQFRQRYPKDWEVVHGWITQTDPEFPSRTLPPGPFSPFTGEILEEWKTLFN